MWLPIIIFENTETRFFTINDAKTFTNVKKSGGYTRNPQWELSNNFLYKGAENTIVMSRNYDQEFICKFDIAWYPFDIQKCTMQFITSLEMSQLVKLTNNCRFTQIKIVDL